MGTFDVTLPSTQPIVFPSRCVVCEKENPDGFVKLSILGAKAEPLLQKAADRVIYDGAIDPKYYGGNTLNKIDGIPACKGCASGLKRYHWGLQFGYYTAWIPGIVPLVLFHAPTIIATPWLILCAVSPGVYTLLRPPAFGASFFGDVANFEFKSQKVAEEFLHLNEVAQLKSKDKPTTGTPS